MLHASGFAEAGEQGAELQERLIAGHDMPLVGPNCYGTINAVNGAALWPDVHGCRRVEQGPALISQSGNIALNLTMNDRGVDFTHVISLGNQASVTVEECLLHFADSPKVTAVGLYLESINDPLEFGRAALACHETRTPVVVLKTGRTDRAGLITKSHTAALSRPAASYDALFERYGIVVVDSLPEFITTLGLLATVGPLPGNRLVSLSCSGGEAALVADRAVHFPVVFEPFAAEHTARVEATLSDLVKVTNPLDYHTFIWGDRPRAGAVLHGGADRSRRRGHAGARLACDRHRGQRMVAHPAGFRRGRGRNRDPRGDRSRTGGEPAPSDPQVRRREGSRRRLLDR